MSFAVHIKSFASKHHRILFYGGWFLINFLQAGLTQLFDDEAYYWVYSRFPAWGYFDHPPMVAFFIRAGYFFFRSELGVRLLVVIASTLTLYIIQKLLARKNDRLFYAICASMALLQIGGFISSPDVPLLFFTSLFFLVYRNFLRKMNLLHSFLMGLVIAGMLYSKYHGILVILFTLASNPKLLKKYQTYIAAGVAWLAFTPQLIWQYRHGFVSVQYQLLERFNAGHYQLNYTTDYLLGQLLLAGPFASIILIWAAFKQRTEDSFERALKMTMTGFYVFFLLSSFRSRVEINWTVAALIPVIILSHHFLSEKQKARQWLYRLVPATLAVVFLLRLYLILDVPVFPGLVLEEVHGNHRWVSAIEKKAGGLPVIFINSYQYASKYWFYSGHPSFSLNNPRYRRNNYNLWPNEDSLRNRKILVLGGWDPVYLKDSISTVKGLMGGMVVPEYASFSGINIRSPDKLVCVNGLVNPVELSLSAYGPAYYPWIVAGMGTIPLQLWVSDGRSHEKIVETGIQLDRYDLAGSRYRVSFPIDLPAGKYKTRFCIPTAVPGNPTVNSVFFNLEVIRSPAADVGSPLVAKEDD